MNRLRQGFWIVFEGIDGVGKSTLIDSVSKELERRGYPVVRTGEPGGTPLGREIRQQLHFSQDHPVPLAEYLLFAADRAQHMSRIVLPALAAKKVVICDRSADSSLAYQGFGRGVDRDLIMLVNARAMQGISPDRVFYLRLTPEEALKRREARGEVLTSFEREKRAFFERVTNGFETVFAGRKNVTILDAVLDPTRLARIAGDDILAILQGLHE